MSEDAPIVATEELSGTAAIIRATQNPTRVSKSRHTRVIGPPSFSVVQIFTGLRALIHYSDLLFVLSAFRLKVRYKQSLLGWVWAILQPLTLMVIYTFIFAHVTKVNTAGTPYSLFVLSGLLPWIFFSSSIANAVHGIVAHPSLLTKMYFPREIIPLSYIAPGIVDFLIGSIILSAMLAHYHVAPTWNLLYAIPMVLILGGFAAGISLFFSAVHVQFRDVGLALPFILQVWMFATPVVYSVQAIPMRFRQLYMLDPCSVAIDGFRAVVIYGRPPDLHAIGTAFAITLTGLILGYTYFKWFEGAIADVI
ncbi:MAG TPA: ABC transporter permease [Candidatus Sulfotelmatobacter sp.]|nr:ABC transporter permease [Candidatus Sulfotelmatobacter sp.]